MVEGRPSKIVLMLLISILYSAAGLAAALAEEEKPSLSLQGSSNVCRIIDAAPLNLSLTLSPNPAPTPTGSGVSLWSDESLAQGRLEKRSARSSGLSETLTTKALPQRDGRFLMAPLCLLKPFDRLPRFTSPLNIASPPAAPLSIRPAPYKRSDRILTQARGYLGTPYRRGGSLQSGPSTDCSGFVQFIYKKSNIDLPRSSPEQARTGAVVAHTLDFAKMLPGDLLFFSRGGRHIGHVGIYLGDGKMIHASTRRRGVIISDLRQPYLEGAFVVAKRLSEVQYPK